MARRLPLRMLLRPLGCLLLAGLVLRAPCADGKRKPTGEPWWSLKPLVQPAPPEVRLTGYDGWARTPVDRFILEKLREKGLEPSPPADKRTLLRRVTFDLLGL